MLQGFCKLTPKPPEKVYGSNHAGSRKSRRQPVAGKGIFQFPFLKRLMLNSSKAEIIILF